MGDILTSPAGTQPFPHERVADLLRESVHAACCSRHVVDRTWVDHIAGCWPVAHLPAAPPSGRHVDATTHPLLRWYATTRSSAPQVLGRVPSAIAPPQMVEEWTAFARPFGITHQLALPLAMRGGIEAYVLSRPDDDYADADLELAGLVLPALGALFRQRAVLDGISAARYDPVRSLGLTERELAVLTLLGEGLTADAMARRLRTSPRTVHKHLEHLYRKLGVRDRLVAVQRAREAGLLAPPPEGEEPRHGPALQAVNSLPSCSKVRSARSSVGAPRRVSPTARTPT
ncbi:response regulator transcription factor [Modestobacter italicus]|uniref:response regulator transcription factor n=1 Tax=Modestobacter italicus (strain DSM 44449 / CECT 9708 / BC 501) TaxID=2732864 RepID=UPI001E56639B|nr:LuxR C-terminal-related transcriptional regulator [Modestobacter marinus]